MNFTIKSKYLKCLTLVILLVITSCASQKIESKLVTGIVIDKKWRLPIPGANIVMKGEKKSTQSDQNGKFQIEAQKGDILIISFVGCSNKTITISSKKIIKLF